MTNDTKREDPESLDPLNQPAPDNPVVRTRFGREIRFKRLYSRFVTQDAEFLGYADDDQDDEKNSGFSVD